MRKYLVTGSTGFVGSHLLGLLRTIDCDVRLLARSKVDNYETIICDLVYDRMPNNTFESIDTVFHLAGFAHDIREPSKVSNLYHSLNVAAAVGLASAVQSGGLVEPEEQAYLDSTLRSKGYNLTSVRAEAVRKTIKELEVIDRLIERQFKNMRLLMQAYESVRFAPQLLKKMAVEIEQLVQRVEQTYEDQRREISRQ